MIKNNQFRRMGLASLSDLVEFAFTHKGARVRCTAGSCDRRHRLTARGGDELFEFQQAEIPFRTPEL